jgi:hypothetical protein
MSLNLMDLFPAFTGPEELDPRLLEIVELCAEIGVPFPAEKNKAYGNWWHSLHEVGHWAVKPDWYIAYAEYLIGDLETSWGSLCVAGNTVSGFERPIDLPILGWYKGGNDVIPEIGMYKDPTLGEHETRVWALQVIQEKGWPHPFDDNTGRVDTGDHFFHKPASARVWATPLINVCELSKQEVLSSFLTLNRDCTGRWLPTWTPSTTTTRAVA